MWRSASRPLLRHSNRHTWQSEPYPCGDQLHLFFIPKSSMHHNIELRTRMLKTESIISQLQKAGVQSNIFRIYIYIYIYITKDSRLAHSDALAQPSFFSSSIRSQGVIDSSLHAALSGHTHMGPRMWDTIHTHTHTHIADGSDDGTSPPREGRVGKIQPRLFGHESC